MGALLKIDIFMSATLRGCYARICIQVPIRITIKRKVKIREHVQEVVYEGDGTSALGVFVSVIP